MVKTVATRSNAESGVSQSVAALTGRATAESYDRIRINFLQQFARYLGAKVCRSRITSMMNRHTAIHLN